MAAYFDHEIEISTSPIKTLKIGLQILDAIDGDFNIEAAAAVNVQVQCAFPGKCSGGSKGRGKKFQPRLNPNDNATRVWASDLSRIRLLTAQRFLA